MEAQALTRAQPSTPEDLLARVAERDASALASLYDLMAPELLAVARQIVSNPRDAAPVVDQVFLRLFKESAGVHRQGASVAAWLALATRAAALDRRRADERVPSSAELRSLRKATTWLPGPQAIALLDERRELIKRVMRQLPRHQIDVLELAVFEGCSEAEIGKRLGEPLGQVRAELRAALRFLRHRLRAVLGEWTANI